MAEAGEKMSQDGVENIAEAMKKMGKALGADEDVEPVNFRKLKALLPERLPGMERTNSSGEKNSAMGIKVSKAEADYSQKDGSGFIKIEITDMGTLHGLTSMATMAWAFGEIDRESDDEYEKTGRFAGFKSYEKFNFKRQRGEMSLLVGKRFVVQLTGRRVEMEDIKNALKKIDLRKLEEMED